MSKANGTPRTMFPLLALLTALLCAPVALSAPVIVKRDGPTVKLDEGIFHGYRSGNVDMFLNIPYAVPP